MGSEMCIRDSIPDVDEFGDDELPRVADQRVRYDPHGRGR